MTAPFEINRVDGRIMIISGIFDIEIRGMHQVDVESRLIKVNDDSSDEIDRITMDRNLKSI